MKPNRSQIMRAAHQNWRRAKSMGWHIGSDPWTFSMCLTLAWEQWRDHADNVAAFRSAPREKRADKPFPLAA